MAPYPAQPIRGRERYRIMMDIRRLDAHNWLTLDKNYMDEHRVRDLLLREKRDKVLRCLPESLASCQETLEVVSEFLTERFPTMFKKTIYENDTWIENMATKERFNIGGQGPTVNGTDALEAAVRLTMEDLSVLMMNEDGEYYLFLARLSPTSPMERSNYFVEVKRPDEDLHDILYRPGSLCEKELSDPSPDEIIIRRERQTFRRLPRTGAIVFGVKTYLTPLRQLPMQQLENLAKEMKTWPDYVSQYKGKDLWGKKVLEYYNRRLTEAQGEPTEKVSTEV
ncbi:hypothetical protein N7466_010368 [Penicillium verhagenii]|uniref:uncharacterized protein n=1 Tax=Penicillium verhagenii TaxID=1562060 RepID=UPI0025453155|nr:uncharacterized protein N7466_010368 [Penicillium verhagenii]KAJ5919425.1 hypothetical protein N7466_010368 [Penicillium verhagenii]